MKWTYSIKNKMAASGALFALCILVLFSNYIDRNHTEKVKNAISTLYEDRLMAEEYILKMTGGMYRMKEELNANRDDSSNVNDINDLLLTIRKEYNAYQKTKLTDEEKQKSDTLLSILRELESDQFSNHHRKLVSVNSAIVTLNELSLIQIKESKQIIEYAETLYLSGKTWSQFVFAIIIIILVVLQGLVMASKTLLPNNASNHPHLN